MKKLVFKTNKSAVANQGGAMEARDHFKNGARSKSQTSRGNLMQIIALLMYIIPFLLVSCGKNEMSSDTDIHDYRIGDVLYAKGILLKRVYHYSDNTRSLYSEYKYDESDRISRIDYANSFHVYLYNVKGELETISTYHESESSPVLFSTVVHSYDNEGNKIKEQVIPENDKLLGMTTSYQYTNGKLTKQEIVVDGQSPQIILFEYKDDKVTKSKSYFQDDCSVAEHFYDQDLLIRSISYKADYPKFIERESRYYYDLNDNLIKAATIVDRMRYLSSLSGPYIDSVEYEYE